MAEFVKIGTVGEFREGRGRRVTIDGRGIAVFRRGEVFHAVDDRCPHMGASLADGRLAAGRVECSWHGWSFDLETGSSDTRAGACIAVHRIRVEGDDVLVFLTDAGPREPTTDDDWFVWEPDGL